MRTISKKYYFRQIIACWMICSMLLALTPVRVAKALDGGYAIIHGNPGIDLTNLPNGITVKVDGMYTIIHWNNLDTASWQYLTFLNNGFINAAVLNRVISGNMTIFNGTLNGENMRIFMINPAGIVFGSGAHINVSQLVASSLDIANNDFLDGAPYEFINGAAAKDVIFNTLADNVTAERLFLIGKNVRNKGGLVAKEFAVMAAGNSVLISEPDSSVAVEVDMGGMDPAEFTVMNKAHVLGEDTFEGSVGDVPTSVEAEHIILAAGDIWSAALVKAYSDGGSDAVATVEIDAAGDVTITDKVIAEATGDGEFDATATIDIDAGGDVQVTAIAEEGDESVREALIQAKTSGGHSNTSKVLICADDDLRVKAEGGWEDNFDVWHGSTASIEAIAESTGRIGQYNTAEVQVGACKSIDVTAISDFYKLKNALSEEASASITAEATGGVRKNKASILTWAEDNTQVKAENGGEAKIRSMAGSIQSQMESPEAATTVISHQGTAEVDSSLGGTAYIASYVFGNSGDVDADAATTKVYAADVVLTGGKSYIMAVGPTQVSEVAPFNLTSRVEETSGDGTAKLIIDYSWCDDCPDCPPCECEEPPPPPVPPEEEVFAPVAPLPPYHIPRIEGCPELTQAASAELGIPKETLQVAIGNSLALNPNIQACQACELLVNNATILKDVDGSRMAAMIQVFNAIAPADAPYTPEMATSIAMAFDNAAEGSQYASAMEFIDAFVQYATALDMLGSPTGDSTAFVMDKYGTGLSGNGNMASFVAGRIEGGQTF